jgi:hypothetical protein
MGLLDRLRRLLGLDPVPPPPPPPPPPRVTVPALLEAHNARRAAAGLAPLAGDGRLQAAAQYHADRMARAGEMSHQLPGEGDLGARLRGLGYAFLRAGENVAWNQRTVAEVMASWMASAGHRANILGDFAGAGLAVAYGSDGAPYYCSVFGKPAIVVPGIAAASPAYSVGAPHVAATPTTAASSVEVLAG